MAYTPPNTFSASTTIQSTQVQSNLTDMKKYVNGEAVSGDLKTSAKWVEAKHILRGSYNPLSNVHDFVSGVAAGITSKPEEESWICDGPTGRIDPTTPDRVAYPNTGIEFYLEDNADVMFRFHASPITPDDKKGDKKWSRIYIYLDESRIIQTKMYATDYKHLGVSEHDPASHWRQWHNFYLAKNLAAGWHSITLRGYTTRRYSYLVDWGCTLEAYYL